MADRRWLRWVSARRGNTASAAVLVASAGALIAAALGSDGYVTPKLDLHDAGVWISSEGRGSIGRTNTQVLQVDVRMQVGADQEALLQADEVVLVQNGAGGENDTLTVVDGRRALPETRYLIPEGALVELGGPSGEGSTVVVLDPSTGDVWTAPGTEIGRLGFPEADAEDEEDEDGAESSAGDWPTPSATVEGGQLAAVGVDGLVRVYSPAEQEVVVLDPAGAEVDRMAIEGESHNESLQLTVVGATPVVLDVEQRLLFRPGSGPVDLEDLGVRPQLQLAGAAAASVMVATDDAVAAVPLDGGVDELATVFEEGTGGSARPLVLEGCTYAAWNVAPSYSRMCEGSEVAADHLGAFVTGKELRFRTNRGKVLINELDSGNAFMLNEGSPGEIDWTHADARDPNEQDDSDAPPEATVNQDVSGVQQPPIAADDDGSGPGREAFATRPDRAVVIDPLRNDTDPNDDVLVIESVSDERGGVVQIVNGGRSVQVTPTAGSRDSVRFGYTINDGFGNRDSAVAVVEIHESGVNGSPILRKKPTTSVVAGRTVVHNVLAEAFDPDGDAMSLVVSSVSVPEDPALGSLGSATANIDGTITYTAPGEIGPGGQMYQGDVAIAFTITDDTGAANAATTSELIVEVLPEAGVAPVARPDHAQTVDGQAVVVDVLANDSDADGDPLRVVSVDPHQLASIDIDAQQRVRVSPTGSGTIVVRYTITDGPNLDSALLRVDVLPKTGTSNPPVAVRDDVLLRPGIPAVVDVLANDRDPDGDVLVVRRVEVPPGTNLAVEVVEHRLLRITTADGGLLQGIAQFTYVVTDGTSEATAMVVVRPGPSSTEEQPPNAVDDVVEVRAGNVGAFDVLANDTDPEGGRLELELGAVPESLADSVFVQGGLIRFIAPSEPGEHRFVYSAVDPTDRKDTAQVVVRVRDAGVPNNGPRPQDLTARTVVGREVVVPIPLTTIDPDGDAVTLLGLSDDPPKHGVVTVVEGDRLTYRPDRKGDGFVGTDTFTYRVRDSLGAEASATIRVGVAPLVAVNSPPVAIDDIRQVPAEGARSIQVLRNDSDPDGDELHLLPGSVRKPDGATWTVSEDGDEIRFDPKGLLAGAEAVFGYSVSDGVLTDDGLVRITIVSEAANESPIARDDRHPDTVPGESVVVDVLKNDSDPDGEHDDLEIIATAGLAGVSIDGSELGFTMPSTDVTIIYTITDSAEGTARAVLRVRAAGSEDGFRVRPTADYDPAETGVNEAVEIDVLANDRVEPGRPKELFQVGGHRFGTCELVAEGKVRFTPEADFIGFGGCSYTMGDGPGDGTDTLRSVGTVGVEVGADQPRPPRTIEQPLRVSANESTKVDLTTAVRDADGNPVEGDIDFGSLSGNDRGVSGDLSGSGVLEVSASASVVDGDVVRLTYKATTDEGEAEGVVTVTVTKYSGALARLSPDTAETVELVDLPPLRVLDNDQRAIEGEALTIVSITQPTGGTASHDEQTVTFRPSDGFHGSTSFTYTVDDGTDQVDRQVSTTVTVNVVGIPDRPAAPSVTRESEAITLSWGQPADNGAPVTGYWIRATGGSGARTDKIGNVSTYRFDGLTNGDEYRFEIGAVNRAVDVAMSDGQLSEPRFGPMSPVIVPNTIPNTPSAPTATFDPAGGIIDVSWVDPGSDGTKVERYQLEVSPPPPGGQPGRIDAPTVEQRVTGLVNGTAYTFRVKAFNRIQGDLEGESEWSASSVAETPAAPPAAPLQPTISEQGDQNITVSWSEPQTNGDAIKHYDVEVFRDGASQGLKRIADPGTRTTTITTDNGPKFTFAVRATNKAGDSTFSARSAEATSFGIPGAVPGAVTATEGDTTSVLTYGAAPPNGNSVKRYEYRIGAGGAWQTLGASPATITGLSNSTSYQFQVRGCNDRGCATEASALSNSIRPFGKPGTPTSFAGNRLGSGGSYTLRWTWAPPATLNGQNSVTYQVSVNGGGYTNATSPYDIGVGYDACRTVSVRAVGDRTAGGRNVGDPTSGIQVCAEPTPPPAYTYSVQARLGGVSNGNVCDNPGTSRCQYMDLLLSGWPPGANPRVSCQVFNGSGVWQEVHAYNAAVNGSGGHGWAHSGGCYIEARRARLVVDGRVSNEVGSY